MRGRSTFLWLTLAAAVGFGLFLVKYEVQALEEELSRLTAAVLKEQRQIHVLGAEWSYLNEPSRLEALAVRHLALTPAGAAQIGTIADLPLRTAPGYDLAPAEGGATIAGGPPVPSAKRKPPANPGPPFRTSRPPHAPAITPVGMTR